MDARLTLGHGFKFLFNIHKFFVHSHVWQSRRWMKKRERLLEHSKIIKSNNKRERMVCAVLTTTTKNKKGKGYIIRGLKDQ